MSEVYVTISPKAQELINRLYAVDQLGVILCPVIDKQNELSVAHIQRDYLSQQGPMTLGVITNRLRSSIRASSAYPDGSTIRSGIGSNVVYAVPHEFGFDGTVNVKEHTRRNPIGDRFRLGTGTTTVDRFTALRMGALSKHQVSQRVRESGKYTLARRGAVQTQSGASVKVKAHTMKMNVKARHYTYNGIKDRLQEYGNAISSAVVKFFGGKS